MNLKTIVDFLESHHLGNPQKGIPYFFWWDDAFWVANPGAEDEFEDGTYDPDSPKKTRDKHYGRAIACGVTAGGRCDIPPLEVLQLLQPKRLDLLDPSGPGKSPNYMELWEKHRENMGKSPNQMKASTTEGFSSQPCLMTRG